MVFFCPKCRKGNVFKGLIKLKSFCNICGCQFNPEKIGDGASWISCFALCVLVVPIILILELNYKLTIAKQLIIFIPLIISTSIVSLKIFTYILLKKLLKSEDNYE